MIVQEIQNDLVRTYSDAGFYIYGGLPEGNYVEAIDPINMGRTYIETNIPIEDEESESEFDLEDLAYAEAGRILMGVNE